MKSTVFAVFAVFVVMTAFQNNLYAATADEVVRETTDHVLEQLEQQRTMLEADPVSIQQVVNELIIPHIDFMQMSTLVLGKHWQSLDDQHKVCFSSGFRNLLVERYAYILLSYDNHNISYEFARDTGNNTLQIITQTISREGTSPLPIKYAMQRSGEQWKAVDLVIDGVSLVRNYLGMFQSQIHTQGLEYFITNFPVCSYQ
jgi:phospholipid transport system substrate-binding protein